MKKLTPGKLKGLKNISTKDGFFIIAALDHRNSLKKLMAPDNPESVSRSLVKNIKIEFTKMLAPHASAVLLDPEYGAPASEKSIRDGAGLILSLEESGYLEEKGRRFTNLLKRCDVKKIRGMNADAVKLLVYYRPDDDSSKKQLDLVKKVAASCKEVDMAFVCEPFIYPLNGEKDFRDNFPDLVIQTAREISALGIDVLKVQFPGNVISQRPAELKKNCEELDSVCKVPWVLLSGGTRYEEYLEQVEIASRCNASGIMVGRAIWQEAFESKSFERIVDFVRTTSCKRLIEIISITQKGLPWFERA